MARPGEYLSREGDSVTVTVLLFASFADVLGRSRMEITIPLGATVGDMVTQVRAAAADRLPPTPLVAVNEEYARYDRVLVPGDELALIPPVAGG
jgi:molybdopterin converting factor small subunit